MRVSDEFDFCKNVPKLNKEQERGVNWNSDISMALKVMVINLAGHAASKQTSSITRIMLETNNSLRHRYVNLTMMCFWSG